MKKVPNWLFWILLEILMYDKGNVIVNSINLLTFAFNKKLIVI